MNHFGKAIFIGVLLSLCMIQAGCSHHSAAAPGGPVVLGVITSSLIEQKVSNKQKNCANDTAEASIYPHERARCRDQSFVGSEVIE